MSVWINTNGKLIVDGSGNPIDCATCPCIGTQAPPPPISAPCCPGNELPATIPALVSFTYDDETSTTMTFDTVYNGGTQKWEGSTTCGANTVTLKHYSVPSDPGFDCWIYDVYCDGVRVISSIRGINCSATPSGGGNTSWASGVSDSDPVNNLKYTCCGGLVADIGFAVDSAGF